VDTYEKIEEFIAQKYGKTTTTRKATGDFMLGDNHAVNVKSNNVEKQNYSPNMISIKKLHKWVFEDGNQLSFIFVDYRQLGDRIEIVNEPVLVPVEHISWDCLSIEAQGYGVIQKISDLKIDSNQSKKQFYAGFLKAYEKYMQKEKRKHERFSSQFIKDLDILDVGN
jgi:hypothetical protein